MSDQMRIDLSALPFVTLDGDGNISSLWAPSSQEGRALGNRALEFMHAHESECLLGQIAKAMGGALGRAEIGFWQAIAESASISAGAGQ